MKKILFVCLAYLLIAVGAFAGGYNYYYAGETVASGGYCDGTTWDTLTDFRLDFDNTDDETNACLSSGTEAGSFTNATTATSGITHPGSGGKALFADGDTHYISFDNSASYFKSTYGRMLFTMNFASDNTNGHVLLNIYGLDNQDELKLEINTGGKFNLMWEDNNDGVITMALIGDFFDIDAYDGD